MKILVTGAKGFIGKNLLFALKNTYKDINICEYDIDCCEEDLYNYCADCNFVFHLAGVNRPKKDSEFITGNYGFTEILISALKKHNNLCPIVMTSSIQAEISNAYGKSKLAGEKLLKEYSEESGAKVFIYRLANVFGKWSRPNYNSVIATFCYNIARDLPIQINDRETKLSLVYIDDVVQEFLRVLNKKDKPKKIKTFSIMLGEVADMLTSYRQSRNSLMLPQQSNPFRKKMYATYLSFLPEDGFLYNLKENKDSRGSFTEILKTLNNGQVSVNITNPGITKGNHYHNTKNEKFVVVKGCAKIKFRRLDSDQIIEYNVNSDRIEAIDIPPGYIHSISNIGDDDLITIMWASETFDSHNPDTYAGKVDLTDE